MRERPGMLVGRSVEEFATALAAGAPTPGGGSAAALSGVLAAALIEMVCDLTIGREKYRDREAGLRRACARAAALRRDLLALVDRDAQAYDAVVAALRLPKGTEREKRARAGALGRATLYATETPMATAEACAVLLGLAVEAARDGNPNAVSDAGTAALLAYAGLRGAVLNVHANLGGIGDAARAAGLRDRVRRLEVDAERRREEALAALAARPGMR
jgi:formiminotetrahydrofolate cyclodeaminase